ncbi:5-formyltetrahydrofolate cyclo-ligase [Thiovibrio frasassiensis]|uniref:5-formyltetrahydrofolate cyclo-ligase n=1 Tax=Thiovibrio frasassiensis TaxID=2984131 RepID=A0A9X4RPU5_9BACT|nr:5-formyltetrahydrofolate cyclo-ligase [Thiovibrio frasassiensis]MDG4475567.1 5-formyltetrahydrofolate cyclo-ligase [Thiovibrio frasassiensis]
MAEERTTLRTKILAARDTLLAGERQRKSRAITERLLALPEFAAARTIFTYVSFRSEVETLGLITHCLDRGVTVSVPLTLPAEHRLLPYAITDIIRDLAPGYCSIPEPLESLPLVDPASIEVVVTPGSVFDAKGGRLGYGGGYYDRFLQTAAPQALRIGLAFDLQVVAAVPLKNHDEQLDYLVTETRTIQFSRVQQ